MNTTTRLLAAAVLGLTAADGRADEPRRPAVRVAPARPLEVTEPVARAAPNIPPPPFDPLDPSRMNPAAADSAKSAFRSAFGTGGAAKPQPNPQPPVAPSKGVTNWMADRWASVKTAVVGPAKPTPAPAPKVGQQPTPPGSSWQANPPFPQPNALKTSPPPQPAAKVNAPTPAPFRGVTANGRTGYAGAPAYRWYGWGTTVPGANPFAPTGDYPAGSSGWYSLSGATPGAFPVPVTNAFRPPPGGEPPMYVSVPPPVPAFAGPKLVYTAPPAGPRPIAESGPGRVVPTVPTTGPDLMRWQPIGGVPQPQPTVAKPVAPPTDPKWTAAAPIFR